MRNFFPTSVLFCVLHSANSQCISRDETRTSELRSCPWFFIDRAWSSKVQYSQKVEFSFFVLLFNILAVQVAKYNMEPGANYSSLAVLLLGGGWGGCFSTDCCWEMHWAIFCCFWRPQRMSAGLINPICDAVSDMWIIQYDQLNLSHHNLKISLLFQRQE